MAVDKILIQYESDIKQLRKDQKKLEKQMLANQQQAKKTGKQIDDSFAKGGKSVNKFGDGLKKLVPIIAGAFAVQKLISFGQELFTTAVRMEAFEKRAKTVFGNASGFIDSFARQSAVGLGFTENQFKGAAAAIGDLLVPLGISRTLAAEMSVESLKLGAALKEFSGDQRSAAEIAGIVAKAFTGEVEGLKALGVTVTQTDKDFIKSIQTKIRDEGATLAQAKALTIYETVLQRSGDALAQYEENSDSLARQQTTLNAELQTIKETLAEDLTPAYLALLKTIGFAVKNIFTSDATNQIREFDDQLAESVDAAIAEADALKEIEKASKVQIITLDSLNFKLKESRDAFKLLEIGSAEFAAKQQEIIAIESKIAAALGKKTEAQKESEKAEKEAIQAEEEHKKVLDELAKSIANMTKLQDDFNKTREAFRETLLEGAAASLEKGLLDQQNILLKSLQNREVTQKEFDDTFAQAQKDFLQQQIFLAEDGSIQQKQLIKELTEFEIAEQKRKAAAIKESEGRLRGIILAGISESLFAIQELETAFFGERDETDEERAEIEFDKQRARLENRVALAQEGSRELKAAEKALSDFTIGQQIRKNDAIIAGDKNRQNKQREAFTIDQSFALAQVAIDTAKAISSLTAASEANPLNAPTAGAAGVIQFIAGLLRIFANIATAKNIISGASFEKGTEDAPGGMAMVGERGAEVMYVPKGAKIMPANKTKLYSEVVSAMMHDDLDRFINENYVLPQVVNARAIEAGISGGDFGGYDDYYLRKDVKKIPGSQMRAAAHITKEMKTIFDEKDFVQRRTF